MKKQCKSCNKYLSVKEFVDRMSGKHMSQCISCRFEKTVEYRAWLKECEKKLLKAETLSEEGMTGYKDPFMRPAKKSASHITTEEGVVLRVAV